MNKIILGSVLVTVMGGAPVVTYFLTGEKETSVKGSERNTIDCKKEENGCQEEDECIPQESENTCPEVK